MARSKLAVSALAMGVFLNACASSGGSVLEESHSPITPPSADLRQRMDRIVLHVDSEAGLRSQPDAAETPESGDKPSAAAKGLKGGAAVGGTVGRGTIMLGCNGTWGLFVVITCPAGIFVGVGTTLAGAVVGGIGGAVVDIASSGSGAAPLGEGVEAVAGRSVVSALAPTPAQALRNRLADAILAKTRTRLVDPTARDAGTQQDTADTRDPLVLIVRINDLRLVRTTDDSPEIWFRIRLSAGLYDDLDGGYRDLRGWRYTTKLGDVESLSETNAAALDPKIDAAMAKVVAAVVEDLFLANGVTRDASDIYVANKIVGNNGSNPLWPGAPFWDPKTNAECGDVAVQRALGRRFAALDPRVYGTIAREKWAEAYKWLRLAENAGTDDPALQEELSALRQKLPSEMVEAAEQEIAGWTPKPCDEQVKKEKEEKEGSGAGRDEPADRPAEVSPSPTPPDERPGRS